MLKVYYIERMTNIDTFTIKSFILNNNTTNIQNISCASFIYCNILQTMWYNVINLTSHMHEFLSKSKMMNIETIH